ncbi:hypothetical protein D3C71_1249620 [compost metagenome]
MIAGVAVAEFGIEIAFVRELVLVRGIDDFVTVQIAVVAVGLVEQLLIARHHHHHQRRLALLGIERLLRDVVVAQRGAQGHDTAEQEAHHDDEEANAQPVDRALAEMEAIRGHGI